MAKTKNIKQLALEAIVIAMDKLKNNIETAMNEDELITNVAGMKTLAEAFSAISNSK